MFRIQQFAKLANVTVRTLHHYDRLGLLTPTLRSARGYRLYRMEDLAQLERILVLRYLGVPLKEIAGLLATGEGDSRQAFEANHGLADTLARQAKVLRERRDGIDRVLNAIATAQRQLETAAEPDWSLYKSILREIHMQENENWSAKYFSPEAKKAIEERKHLWSPEMQEKVTADWKQMYADVESAIGRGVDPKSEEGQALAARWVKLVEGFTGGNAEVVAGLRRLYADQANWPATVDPQVKSNAPRPELTAFISAARGSC
ncbi:MerR family transcriptional regulator [Acidobacteria bacterium AB60]|nr:MerR family transcriptional regulator [Acidobacteria bacterium AB60]